MTRHRVIVTCYIEIDPIAGPYVDDQEVHDAFFIDANRRGADDIVIEIEADEYE